MYTAINTSTLIISFNFLSKKIPVDIFLLPFNINILLVLVYKKHQGVLHYYRIQYHVISTYFLEFRCDQFSDIIFYYTPIIDSIVFTIIEYS